MSEELYTSAATTARQTSHRSSNDDIPPAVIAEGIGINGDQGPVFGPLDFTIPGQGLTVLAGRRGSGRTALALAISGRMKVDSGRLEVLPAHAGMIPTASTTSRRRTGAPRACGDDPSYHVSSSPHARCSPRMRG